MRTPQLLVLLLGGVLVGLLYFFGKTKEEAKKTTAIEVQDVFATYEQLKLAELPTSDAARITTINNQMALQPTSEQTIELSELWENVGNYPLGAYYFYKSNELNSDSANWEISGDKLYNSYKNYADTLITDNLLTFALASYERAVETNVENLPLKMKLAEVYVESPQPMKGVLMLREIVDSIPNYVPALMRLGRLSMQTGQYEKALSRFNQVLEVEPSNTEAIYFLALANEGLGNIDETIRLLEVCKAMVQIPAFTEEIDAYILNLKKQKL